jgi:hypothetical protein
MDTVIHNEGGCWHTGNSRYVAPEDGVYELGAIIRLIGDNYSDMNMAVGIGVDGGDAGTDGPFVQWYTFPTGGPDPAFRTSVRYHRRMVLDQGDEVLLYCMSSRASLSFAKVHMTAMKAGSPLV